MINFSLFAPFLAVTQNWGLSRGLGISILPELLLYRTHFQIAVRELDYPLTRKICVALQGVDTLSHAARQFLNMLFSSHWDWEEQAPFTRMEHAGQKIHF